MNTQVPKNSLEGWPPGTYEFNKMGVYYVPHGATHAGPFTKPEEYSAWVKQVDDSRKNMEQAAKDLTDKVYTGQFPAANFILGPQEGREAAFIYAARCLLRDKGGPHLIFDCGLFSGTFHDLSRLINYGEQEQIYEQKSYQQTVDDFPDTPVKQAVMAKLNGG